MAASLINRLAKTKPSLRLLASLNTAVAPKSAPRIVSSDLDSAETLIPRDIKLDPFSLSSSQCSQIVFPSFPFGYCLNPRVSPSVGPNQFEEVESESESEESRTVWADSTKQKRKKKMNKHKYQKRRKLLRRKS